MLEERGVFPPRPEFSARAHVRSLGDDRRLAGAARGAPQGYWGGRARAAMLACARIGAVHSVVFGGFSAEALRERMNDAGAKVLITADGGWRKGAVVPLKRNVDDALKDVPSIQKVIVLQRTSKETPP